MTSPAVTGLLDGFTTPPVLSRPYIRWWWPHGLVDTDEIRRETQQIADAGFGGIEIQDVHHSIPTGTDVEAGSYGWATESWINAVMAALDAANVNGLEHDMAFGPCWPMAVPSIAPDDPGAAKEIVLGKKFVTGGETYDGPVPPPFSEPKDNVTEQTLVAVQAWRLANDSDVSDNPVYLEYGSMIDLTNDVDNDNNITFTPPDDAAWLIYSAVARGTGQRPEDYPHTQPASYVVDHFSQKGVQVVKDYWNDHVFSDELLSLLSESRTAFMEDSLELVSVTYWTMNFPEEFKKRRGYDIGSILPVLTQYEDEAYLFEFADPDAQRGALNDYHDTVSDLYLENHVKPLKEWVNQLEIDYRIQPYGIPGLDGIRAAAEVDVLEGESLGFRDNIHNFRSLSGAASMAGITRVSNELGAYDRQAYETTWIKILGTVNPEFVAGVNQNVLHGFSYLHTPNATWPGFAAFTPYKGRIGYSESWGPRQPTWHHASDFTGYMGRVQYILQRGTPKYDCAFFRQSGAVDSNYAGAYFSTSDATKIGWTTTYIDASMFKLPNAYVEGARFAPEAGNLSLIAIDAYPTAALTEEAAVTLYDYAKDGLPILLIGDWSSPQPYGLGQANSTTVASTVKDMLNLSNIVNVRDSSEAPEGLDRLGVEPAVNYSSPSLIHTHRQDGDLDHYFFVANSSEVDHADVTVPTRLPNVVPIQLDPWTGNSSVLPIYSLSDGQLKFPIHLQPNQTALITVAPLSVSGRPHYATHSTAQSIVRDLNGKRLLARSTEAGTYTTTLDDGIVRNSTFAEPLPTMELKDWTLTVDSWQPHDDDDADPSDDISAIKLERHQLNLTSLEPWTSIDGLQDVSGNGTYTTTFDLGTSETPYTTDAMGAHLSLEKLSGSFRAHINGIPLPPLDQLAVEFDVSIWLRNGTNSVEIEVATSLLNRMRVLQPDVYDVDRQSFGLLGVTLRPFRQEVVT